MLTSSINITSLDALHDDVARFMLADWYEECKDPRAWSTRYGIDLVEIPDKSFYIGVYPVTQEQYEKVMDVNPSWFSSTGGGKDKVKGMDTSKFPVENVNWGDAVEFCKKLSELDGLLDYRLPTEEEWEDACRAGTTTEFNFGDSISSTQANFNGNYPYGGAGKGKNLERTCQVGSYKPNDWGLYDMHGNVFEWTSSQEGSYQVIRGGYWDNDGQHCRSAVRCNCEPAYRFNGLGFRVVAETKF